MRKYNVAVLGASGAVGSKIISILEERDFPIEKIKFLGNSSKGDKLVFKGKTYAIEPVSSDSFKGIDIAWFCVEADISQRIAPLAISSGAVVIDNSSAFRMDPKIPLVIPEVNPSDLDSHKGIIANPNCSTIQMLVVLKPIHDAYKIKRVVVSTYQSVSGTGKAAVDELDSQVKNYYEDKTIESFVYPHQILFNVIPHIDSFLNTGYTKEEMKMVNETQKILDSSIKVTATAVRLPVITSHSESVNIETKLPFDIHYLKDLLSKSPGIKVLDLPGEKLYPMPINTSGKDSVYVGRIRRDDTIKNGLNLWIVGDNLRKGAALNAVQIAETLIYRNLLGR